MVDSELTLVNSFNQSDLTLFVIVVLCIYVTEAFYELEKRLYGYHSGISR